MNDNLIIVESDSKGSVSSSLKRGMESESHSLPFVNGDFKLETILLSDDSKMERAYGESLTDVAPSRDYLKTLFLMKSYMGENLVKKPMPSLVLIAT